MPDQPSTPLQDGDSGWTGVNERLDARSLPPGVAAAATNYRFRRRRAEPRLGRRILRCGRSDNGWKWNDPYGGAVVSNPATGSEHILVAADGGVWRTRLNSVAVPVPLPAGVTLTRKTFAMFVQAFDAIYLLRGDDTQLPPLICTDLTTGFTALPLPEGSGLALPAARFGLYFGARFWAVQGNDYAWVSDPNTALFHVDTIFKVTEGDGDRLSWLLAWGPNSVVAGKASRVLIYQGAASNPATAPEQPLTSQYGAPYPLAVVAADTQAFWLTGGGIASLQLTQLNQQQATSTLLSRDLPETFGRVFWPACACARLAVHGGYLHCALPVDNSPVNNLVAVYDLENQAWCGADEGPAVGVVDWLKPLLHGQRQLCYLGTDGHLHQMDWAYADEVDTAGAIAPTAIAQRLLTRAYPQGQRGQVTAALFGLATWWPSYSVNVQRPGALDKSLLVGPITRSATKSTKFGQADRVATNADGQWHVARFEDYSLMIPAGGAHSNPVGGFDVQPAGTDGVDPNLHQHWQQTVALGELGDAAQIEFVNTQGRLVLLREITEGSTVVPQKGLSVS